jgi:hypothetical protein
MMKLCTLVDVPDVINHANFHCRVMGTLQASKDQKGGFAFELHMVLTT